MLRTILSTLVRLLAFGAGGIALLQ